jgi:hypothetical protein
MRRDCEPEGSPGPATVNCERPARLRYRPARRHTGDRRQARTRRTAGVRNVVVDRGFGRRERLRPFADIALVWCLVFVR